MYELKEYGNNIRGREGRYWIVVDSENGMETCRRFEAYPWHASSNSGYSPYIDVVYWNEMEIPYVETRIYFMKVKAEDSEKDVFFLETVQLSREETIVNVLEDIVLFPIPTDSSPRTILGDVCGVSPIFVSTDFFKPLPYQTFTSAVDRVIHHSEIKRFDEHKQHLLDESLEISDAVLGVVSRVREQRVCFERENHIERR